MAHVAHHLEEKERTRDIEIDENLTFSDLLLSEAVLCGLHAAGFRRPSPIQLAAIPLGRCGLDLVVQAKSGTGKTCVLAVVALEAVSAASPATQVLVLAPTREVAVQVSQVVDTLAVAMPGLNTAAFIGGTKLTEDVAKLKQCQVVVGTPGRLAQLVSLGHLRLECVRLLVLDEADRLLEGNFLGPVLDLARALPHNKQVLCLSATYSDAAAAQAESLMRSPSHVRLGRESPALLGVNQLVRRLPPAATAPLRQAAKATELIKVLSRVTFNQCLVFSGSQLRAESLCHRLRAEGWPAAHLTAAQCQTERLAALKALCSHRCRVLVATDLAARGLDSPHVNLVINVDLPPDPATYLHRAGRAGRYGSRGAAVTLACGPEEWYGVRAIATLANVKLLLVGEEWPGTLATLKTKGRRKTGIEKKVKEGEPERNEEEGEKDEQNKLKEEKETDNPENENKTEMKQEETEDTDEEKATQGERKLKGEDGVIRLEEVEGLPEEEARAWLKEHKPYRKEGGSQGKQERQNGIVKSNTDLKGKNNRVKGERNIKGDEEENGEAMGRKTRKQETGNDRQGESDSNDSEDEDKENQGKNRKNRKKERRGSTNDTPEKQKDRGQNNKTDIGKSKTETGDKNMAMSAVKRLWMRPLPVTMSYSQLLSDSTQRYDNSTPPDTCLRVPPWPVDAKLTEMEILAIEKHMKEVKDEVKGRKAALEGVKVDVVSLLSALMEGREGRDVLGEVTQSAPNVAPPQDRDSDSDATSCSSDSSSTSEYPTSEHSKAQKNLMSSTSGRHHTTTSSSTESKTSTGANQERKDLKRRSPLTECKNAQFLSSDNRQRHVSPSGFVPPSQPTDSTGHPPSQAVPHGASREQLPSATGARPKEGRSQPKESKEDTSKGQKSYPSHRNKKKEQAKNDYQGYGEWVPVEENQTKNQDYEDYYQGYEGQDYASQGYQNYSQWYQCENQNYNQEYQNYMYYQGQDYGQCYQGYSRHTHAHMNAYIESACKFASMMEYVSTMGRVSLQVAEGYHARNRQWRKQQHGRHSNTPQADL